MEEDYSIYGGAAALIKCTAQWEDAASLSDPLASSALSLMQLADPTREWTRGVALKALKERMECIGQNNLSGMEMLLAAQAQVLHLLFTRAVGKYASTPDEKGTAYASLALRSQSLCRQVIATLASIKMQKQRNELLRAQPFVGLTNRELIPNYPK